MYFQVNSIDFKNAIKKCERIARGNRIQEVLNNIYIKANDDCIVLQATNLDISISVKVIAEVEHPGEITLSASKLSEISGIASGLVAFSALEANVVLIEFAKSKFEVQGITAEEFPKSIFDFLDDENIETTDLGIDLTNGLEKVIGYAQDDNSQVLSGVSLSLTMGKYELVGCDGGRLAVYSNTVDTDADFNLVIPKSATRELLGLGVPEEIKFIHKKTDISWIAFDLGDVKFRTSLMAESYPKYNGLIPKNYDKSCLIDKNQFLEACNQLQIIAGDINIEGLKTPLVTMELIKNKGVKFSTSDGRNKSELILNTNIQSDNLTFVFNNSYLLDFLKNSKGQSVKVEYGHNNQGVLFTDVEDPNYLALIMPCQ